MNTSKHCSKCKIYKNHEEFHDNKKSKDKKASWCKECSNKFKKPWTNTQEASKRNSEYFQENKESIKLRRRERYATDLQFRISCNLRNRLGKAIKGRVKKGSAIKDLGCSIEEFKRHIENKFKPGMSWENYGFGILKWNVDHIIPLSSFDLQNREEFVKACHYTNLQPLWHIDNMIKSDKINT